MAEILTQSQIDELLNELVSENVENTNVKIEEHIVKSYDFKSPKKMSRDQHKALASLTDIIGRHLAAYLASLLRSYCEVNSIIIDEHPYYEYNNSLPDVSLTAVIGVDAINGYILLDLSNNITYALIQRMLGGNIDTTIVPEREFTEIETALMERVYKRLCLIIQEALNNIPDITVTLKSIETSSRFIKAIRMEEVVEVIVYNITAGMIKGTITACVPYTNVETLITSSDKFQSRGTGIKTSDEESKKALLSELSNSHIDVCALLGNAKLSLKDVMGLQTGDVIKLDQRIGNSVVITVNKNKWFVGELGVKKNQMAIKINKYYKGGAEK